ncbi:MAG: aminoacyl-tRNA hydrolase [Methanofastidiosum sp.]
MDELVQYYVINSDLNMSPGKIAVSVAHVATIVALDADSNIDFFDWYYEHNQKKIILRGKQKDLERLVNQGFYYIKDIGLKEVNEGALTCVGLGVMWKSQAQQYIKRLQLL